MKDDIKENQNQVKGSVAAFKVFNKVVSLDKLIDRIDNFVQDYTYALASCNKKTDEFIDFINTKQDDFKSDAKKYDEILTKEIKDILKQKNELEEYFEVLNKDFGDYKVMSLFNNIVDDSNSFFENFPNYKSFVENLEKSKNENGEKMPKEVDVQNIKLHLKKIITSLTDDTEKALAKCDICKELYNKKITDIKFVKLEQLIEQVKNDEEVCKTFHKTLQSNIQQKLTECGGSFIKFQTETKSFMTQYNIAYEKMRKDSNLVFDEIKEFKTLLKPQSKRKQSDKTKQSAKKTSSCSVNNETKLLISFENSVQKSLDTVRRNFRNDTLHYNDKVDSLKMVLDKK